jgi:uncharacterized membrane protein
MPIIDPMYLYLIEVLHNIDAFNQVVFIMSSIIMFIFVVVYPETIKNDDDKQVKKYMCICGIAWLLSLVICVFVPTKDAMYKMLIASYVTTDNIQIVNDAIKTNLQDYLNMLGETVKNMR